MDEKKAEVFTLVVSSRSVRFGSWSVGKRCRLASPKACPQHSKEGGWAPLRPGLGAKNQRGPRGASVTKGGAVSQLVLRPLSVKKKEDILIRGCSGSCSASAWLSRSAQKCGHTLFWLFL